MVALDGATPGEPSRLKVERLYRKLVAKLNKLPAARRRQLARRLTAMKAGRITAAIRAAITKSDDSIASIAWRSELNPSQLYRFLGGGSLTTESLDKLAETLDLELKPSMRKAASTSRKSASTKHAG